MKLPRHVAIILDGNGRWAKAKGMPRSFGHQEGLKALVELIKYTNSIGLEELSVFGFSTENWNRPRTEINYIMGLVEKGYKNYQEKIKTMDLKIKIVGELEMLKPNLQKIANELEEATKDNKGMTLNVCFSYGGKQELVRAFKKLEGQEITIEKIQNNLDIKTDVDLLIRTGGNQRISNFLIWQLAYAELYFTEVYFPDFKKEDFDQAIEYYNKQERRFGGLK
ncbi:MAG: polyprenyl diphosphate synthase [Bacilli bacterium]|nr:polyprenyl diphosphate synthase [Bacilli bacterium]HOC97541.1 polyprenyl diphosphate synthase [Bacilli bacterium]HQM17673.1 polyprenyl diphosphate synthase [Bacilli bacterium]